MFVRKATKDDAERVAEFAMKLVEQHVGYNPLRFTRIATLAGMRTFYGEQTEADDAILLVAELDGEVVGFAYVGYEEKNYAELATRAAWLHDIYVTEPVRKSGAGQKLIEAAATVAKDFGASKLLLSVAEKNSAARRFFEQMGFETTMHEMMRGVDD